MLYYHPTGFTKNEQWKPIEGYEGRYEISSYGRVKMLSKKGGGKITQGRLNKNGYAAIKLCRCGRGRNFAVHRLVVDAFLPPDPSRPHTNHKDGNKLNNYVGNLERVTPQENGAHYSLVLRRNRKEQEGYLCTSPLS